MSDSANPPTDKELFERVRTHLLAQGKRAIDKDDKCVYRAPGGLKCALGCLITDEAYTSICEGAGPGHVRVRDGEWVGGGYLQGDALANALTRSGIPARASTRCMLQELQGIHDRIEPRGWAEHLDGLARNGFNSEDMFR